MVVLLIGGGSPLMDAMISKLTKNGHRVYLLTGQRNKRFSYKHVFETYNFPYDSGSIKDIFESTRPDIVVFMGAYDTNFDWDSDARQESVRYTAGLVNILSAYSVVKGGKFVYFSSQEVFGKIYIDNISEDESVSPKGYKAMALVQGEETCENFRRNQGADTMIFRFDHMYWVPEKGKIEDNDCFRMCLDALKTGKISVNERRVFSMIYLNDAVELAYRALCEKNLKHSIYHISSMDAINEKQLAEKIREEMGGDITVVDSTVGANNRLILDCGRYQDELRYELFHDYEKGIKNVIPYMRRHSNSFISEADEGGGAAVKLWNLVRRIVGALFPYIESLIVFALVFSLSEHAADSEFLAKIDIYLLYVLLFSVVHGQNEAVFSALLAMMGYCYRQMLDYSLFEVLLDYNTYVWIAQLFIVGLVVGYIKDQLDYISEEGKCRIQYLNGQLKDIEDINESNVKIKHNFESQIINHRESLGKIYEISSSLEQYGPEEVLFYAAQVLSKLMDCRDVAVYNVANRDYARLFSSTSPNARRLGNSIKYTGMDELYGELKEHRVYINRNMTEKMPMMASAVYSEDDMQLIILLWGVPWERMTLGEANRLTIVGHLIQNAVVRANRYLDALRNQRYIEGTSVLEEEAFTHLVKAFFDARDNGLTEYILLEILTSERNYEYVAGQLGSTIRQTDYLGIFKSGGLYALLPNTNKENVGGIIERFQEAGYKCRIDEEAVL